MILEVGVRDDVELVALALGPAHERQLPVRPAGRSAVRRQVVEHQVGDVARRLPVGRVHRRHPLAGPVGLVRGSRAPSAAGATPASRRCTGCARRSRCRRARCWCRGPAGSVPGSRPAAVARRRTRGSCGSCRRRRSTGRPRSTRIANRRRPSPRSPRATRTRARWRRTGVGWSSTGTPCSSNTTVRSTPILATSIDTVAAARRRQVQRRPCAARARARARPASGAARRVSPERAVSRVASTSSPGVRAIRS